MPPDVGIASRTGDLGGNQIALGGVSAVSWFCVQTDSHAEHGVMLDLAAKRFHPYLPQYAATQKRYGRVETVIRPLFPRHLFASCDLTERTWAAILSIRGVKGLIRGAGGLPRVAKASEIERLQALGRAADGVICAGLPGMGPLQPAEIETGASVQPLSGAWINWTGICQWSEGQRLGVLMTIFGRDTVVTMDRAAVRVV